jgi:tetratricopeptide (TPR) repeat protein
MLPLPPAAPTVHRPRSAHAGMSDAAKKEMKESYQKATRAFDLRNFDEAIEAYKRTYELGGDAPMLYNIAQALRLSQRPDEAVLYYRRYLARAPKAKNRDEVQSRIAELTAQPQ